MGTTENCVPRVTLGDQWEHGRKGYTGGLMRSAYPGLHSGTNEIGGGGGGGGGGGTNENMVERATQED